MNLYRILRRALNGASSIWYEESIGSMKSGVINENSSTS
jgi:hypothetical protein